ncbi:Os11g0267201 [Oryza sativa Japonica Group]|uniref:Uncharacterized protein n=2 Tax=Oryza sativa subsp. japonica TaxID=39947 RepID=A0A8J8XQ48_ORYSJ|nr:hypothetical protein OsJ_33588 [Oryza sativa Japonica Group]BAT13545.1 Os11g0267201 [Oryza sativa Japonica Group]
MCDVYIHDYLAYNHDDIELALGDSNYDTIELHLGHSHNHRHCFIMCAQDDVDLALGHSNSSVMELTLDHIMDLELCHSHRLDFHGDNICNVVELPLSHDHIFLAYGHDGVDLAPDHINNSVLELALHQPMELELGHGHRLDVHGNLGIRKFCITGKGVLHDMNLVEIIQNHLGTMVFA